MFPVRVRLAALVGILAASMAGAAAVAVPVVAAESAILDFSVSGIRVGQVAFDAREGTGGSYAMASRIETAGVAGLLMDYFYDGTSSGTVDAKGRVVPASFDARSRSPRADRASRIEFRNGVPVKVSIEPPRSSAPDPAKQAGTLDPVSAGFRLLREQPEATVCDATVDVFDGSRRSRLTLGKPQPVEGGVTCAGRFNRLEGEAHTLSSARQLDFRLTFRSVGDGRLRIERIETPTKFGTAVLARRS